MRGIAVGQAAAADIEALRANDGRYAASPVYGAGPPQPGLWVWAPPPSLQVAQTPWMATMQPFMLHSTSQFRALPPPALNDPHYLADLDETMKYGSQTSTYRAAITHATPTMSATDVAWFWNANAITQAQSTRRSGAQPERPAP